MNLSLKLFCLLIITIGIQVSVHTADLGGSRPIDDYDTRSLEFSTKSMNGSPAGVEEDNYNQPEYQQGGGQSYLTSSLPADELTDMPSVINLKNASYESDMYTSEGNEKGNIIYSTHLSKEERYFNNSVIKENDDVTWANNTNVPKQNSSSEASLKNNNSPYDNSEPIGWREGEDTNGTTNEPFSYSALPSDELINMESVLHFENVSSDSTKYTRKDNEKGEPSKEGRYFNSSFIKENNNVTGLNNTNVLKQNSSPGVALNDTIYDESEVFDWRKREDTYDITTPEQFPYSVLLIMMMAGKDFSICTGSIITEEWVLTASHCLYGVDTVVVYAGGNSKQEYVDYQRKIRPLPSTAQVLRSAELIVHPLFGGDSKDCDVGLVRVEGSFNMTKAVNKVRLATTPWKQSYHSYTTCNMTGFGVVQLGVKKKDDTHRKTHHLDVKNPCLCSFRLQIIFGKETSSRYICTRPKKDYGVCPGDSGGGLVCEGMVRAVTMQLVKLRDTEYCDIALLAPMQCGGINTLSVFEDICPFLPWINSHVKMFNKSEISPKCVYVSGSPCVNSSKFLLMFSHLVVVLIKLFFL